MVVNTTTHPQLGTQKAKLASVDPMVPNQVTKLEYDLGDKFHTFKKGHKIMVQVQSSWFPMFDRNPQKFVDIYHAQEKDYQKATQRIYRGSGNSSHVQLSVLQK